MAGAGFKTFVDGDILTAAQVNTYLMEQSVMVFASAAARTTAIASPSEGMVTYRTDNNVIEYYDGAAWQPILDQDVIAAKGDLIVGTGDDTVAALSVGTNGHVLTADSSTATGLKWASAGGKVLQVVQASSTTSTTVSTGTFTDTSLTASITPSAATSKILVLVAQLFYRETTDSQAGHGMRLLRGATAIHTISDANGNGAGYTIGGGDSSQGINAIVSMVYLDSPNTTSSTAYKTQGRTGSGSGGDVKYQFSSLPSTITLLEIGA